MKKRDKIVIFGTSITSRDLCNNIKEDGLIDVVAYTINRAYIQESELDGLPIIPFEEIEQFYPPSEVQILNTIGYSQMNQSREKVFYKIKEKGYKNYTYISKNAILYSDDIGEGNIIGGGVYIGANVTLGRGNFVSPGVVLSHRIDVGDFNFFSTGVKSAGVVRITNNCYIGIGSVLNNAIVLAPRTFVGAMTFVWKSTEEDRAYVGNPAKMIKAKSMLVIDVITNPTI